MDLVLKNLSERRQKAEQLIRKGTAIIERGRAEIAECDRFERFYLAAIGSAEGALARMDRAADGAADKVLARLQEQSAETVARRVEDSINPADHILVYLDRQKTLKAAIKSILRDHPEGLPSGDLLNELRCNGYPNLMRTSMSPQLSRMKGKDVVNVEGRWKLIKDENAAPFL